ncbi:hypothetical protein O7605_14645 [Verrucosispora sp. WMMA2121]|uniref:hypothetical protein n=1 Tax=Verrucosispora sp. WMMA2121 TaxID=3015164 RepID=UPI0022B5F9EF|nr:hypothetical protein [Verrucosispora sp. WMMA2121]MCZ7420755.1 hypothetical protein [Verrucosispora sp. WMMA2121]
MTNDDTEHEHARPGRRLRDLGRPVVVLMAPLLLRLANRDKEFVWTLEEVHGHARDWPPSGGDAEMANLFRFQAWFGLSMIPLAAYAGASLLRSGSDGDSTLVTVMVLTATVGMFTLGMALVSGLKWGLAQYFTPDLDRRLGPPRRRDARPRSRRPGFLVRLCLPSNLDWVLALVFASCMAPNAYP